MKMYESTIKKITDLTPYANNARTHSQEQIKQIAQSIQEFGFTNPVLIDENGGIIAGHGRVMAANSLNIEQIPCVVIAGLSETQKRAYVIADNKIALNAEWDIKLLELELDAIKESGYEIQLIGFEDEELSELFEENEKKQEQQKTEYKDTAPKHEEAKKLQTEWETKNGQLWALGEHRILCGDSTKKEDVKKLLSNKYNQPDQPYLMVTDPPYGVNYDAQWRVDILGNEKCANGKVINDDIADWTQTWSHFVDNGGCVAYVWHAATQSPIVADSLFSVGLEIRNLIIWAKNSLVISRGNYHNQHEPCWYVVKKGCSAKFTEERTHSTLFKNIQDIVRPGELVDLAKDEAKKVYAIRADRSCLWQIPKPKKSETGHSTQKPIECMERAIRNHPEIDFIYEPFSGSGTTIIACENQKRKCRAIEINPEYVAIALQRWHEHTGKMPYLITE